MGEEEKYLRKKLKDYEIYTWILLMLSSYFFVGIMIKLFHEQFSEAATIVYIMVLFLGVVSYLLYQIHKIYNKLEKHEQN